MSPIETARSLNIKNLNVERAVTMFLLWLSWHQDDLAGAVKFAGDQIDTEEEIDQFKEALESLDNKGRSGMKIGDLYESSDGDVYEITKIIIGDITVKIVKESESRKPQPLGSEFTWLLAWFRESISDGDFWKVSQISVRIK